MILGVWDGHDAGACLLEGSKILAAVNEERLSRRKLEIGFPRLAVQHCLKIAGVEAGQIESAAFSTSDPAKTLGRLFPFILERHYLLRRRKVQPAFLNWQKKFKFRLTALPSNPFCERLSKSLIEGRLKKLGFDNFRLELVDHHQAHAAAAAFASPFQEATVITMDGLGDGASATFSVLKNGKLETLKRISALDSIGVFFEQVTYLLNMRELEDEGKVMALADYSLPLSRENNPLDDLFQVEGLAIKARLSPTRMFESLRKILWSTPFEQFSRYAQDTLQDKAAVLIRNVLRETGIPNLCLAGGLFANVKLNRLLRRLPETKDWFVFPHMGDGGLALGAAAWANYRQNGITSLAFPDVFLGSEFSEEEMETAIKNSGLNYRREDDIAEKAARLIANGKVVLWFQGRGEYGPRALGHRSILAPCDSQTVKDALNLKLKRRSWFQPFCPSMLEEDALELLDDYREGESAPFMTMAYATRIEAAKRLAAVTSVDGSCRPQIIPRSENHLYRTLLQEVKKLTGAGCVLNTSFNLHGEPLVETPQDALKVMTSYAFPYLVLGNFLVEREV